MTIETNLRKHPRFQFPLETDEYFGTVDFERLSDDYLYTFGRGGAGFLSQSPDAMVTGREPLVTAFYFKGLSDQIYKFEAEVRYITPRTLAGTELILYGVEFTSPSDRRISEIVSFLEICRRQGKIVRQDSTVPRPQ